MGAVAGHWGQESLLANGVGEAQLVGMGSQVLLLFGIEKLMRRCVGNQGSGAEVLKKLWCDTAHVEERRDDTLASAPSNLPHQHQTIVTINIKG